MRFGYVVTLVSDDAAAQFSALANRGQKVWPWLHLRMLFMAYVLDLIDEPTPGKEHRLKTRREMVDGKSCSHFWTVHNGLRKEGLNEQIHQPRRSRLVVAAKRFHADSHANNLPTVVACAWGLFYLVAVITAGSQP